jgi:uncharacterized protein with HEPN domain
MTSPRLIDYLRHMLEATNRISSYVEGLTLASFTVNGLIQDAVIRNLEVLGEISRRIETQYPEFAAAHPELPLSVAYQMRNAVAHGYFQVDLDVVWATVTSDLPPLNRLLSELHDEVVRLV